MKHIRLKETISTNEHLQHLLAAEALDEGTVVVADYQTGGRGQDDNNWESEAGKNLLFSILLRPDFLEAEEQFAIAEVAALAVKNVLSKILRDHVTIKWANDIYWRDRKVAGILIEHNVEGGQILSSVVGIGLNVNQQGFAGDAPNPISMKEITGTHYSLNELLQKIQLAILRQYIELMEDGFDAVHRNYLNALYRKEGFHDYEAAGKTFGAVLVDVLKTGQLVLEDKHYNQFTFDIKEIKFVLN